MPAERLTQALAGVARRVLGGEDFHRRARASHRVGEDEEDVRLLARELGLESAAEVLAMAEQTSGDRLDPASLAAI